MCGRVHSVTTLKYLHTLERYHCVSYCQTGVTCSVKYRALTDVSTAWVKKLLPSVLLVPVGLGVAVQSREHNRQNLCCVVADQAHDVLVVPVVQSSLCHLQKTKHLSQAYITDSQHHSTWITHLTRVMSVTWKCGLDTHLASCLKRGSCTLTNSEGSMTSRISSSSLRNITSLGLWVFGQYFSRAITTCGGDEERWW